MLVLNDDIIEAFGDYFQVLNKQSTVLTESVYFPNEKPNSILSFLFYIFLSTIVCQQQKAGCQHF